ncbi:MAG: alpha/beta hydrolase [Thermoplasmataceae archaeon]
MKRLTVNSRFGEISYLYRQGDIPMIFLHGLGGTGNSWIRMNSFLDTRFSLYMIDLLGHGRSARPDIPYTIENQCEALDDFIAGLSLKGFALVGNSYGGWVSLRYTVTRKTPRKLVLVDSAGINRTARETGEEYADSFINRLVSLYRYNDPKIMKKIVENNARLGEKISDDQLSQISAKTCIVWGGMDRIIPLENGERLHHLIPASELDVIADAGHVPQVEKPEELSGILNRFIS